MSRMRIKWAWMISVVLLVSCQATGSATPSVDDEAAGDFVRYPPIDTPVFEALSSQPFSFDPPLPQGQSLFRAGALTYDGQQFYLFVNLYSDDEGPNAVYIATSEDGLNWTLHEEPVVQASPGSGTFYLASDILEDEAGTWHLYLSTNLTGPGFTPQFSIWQATAAALDGPWTLGDEPLLERGAPDAWDQGAVLLPLVLETEFGYVMYYHGSSTSEGNMGTSIGLAVSVDGVDWVRGIPGGAESPYPENDNVVASRFDGDWGDVMARDVWRTSNGWQMLYIQFFGQTQFPELRMATSPDGVDWDPMDEPVSFTLSGLEYFPGPLDAVLLPRQDGYDLVIWTFRSYNELDLYMTQIRMEE
ncbi:MAG: hypothetical protein PVG63_07670 [Anaerolineales bacterium]